MTEATMTNGFTTLNDRIRKLTIKYTALVTRNQRAALQQNYFTENDKTQKKISQSYDDGSKMYLMLYSVTCNQKFGSWEI